jgi:hypothetical protein
MRKDKKTAAKNPDVTGRERAHEQPDGKGRGSIFFFRVESYFGVAKQVF